MFVFAWFMFSKWEMALREGRCKPSTNCFRTRIHRLNARMEADYENTYDFRRQEQFSGTQYSVKWPWFFKEEIEPNELYNTRLWTQTSSKFTAYVLFCYIALFIDSKNILIRFVDNLLRESLIFRIFASWWRHLDVILCNPCWCHLH